jgi:hypothetical protein
MIVGGLILLVVVVAAIGFRSGGDSAPLKRSDLLQMRRYYERVHREDVLPFE